MKKSLLLTILIVATLTLGGCGGGGSEVTNVSTSTTMGQELQDLDKSYKEGIINEDQYDSAKKKILNRYDN
jgi:hypothetical protein